MLQEIFIYGNEKTYDKLLAKGHTDKNGIAVIDYTSEQMEKIQKENQNPFVYVVNGKDKAAFAPSSHNSWREGVSTASMKNARKPQQRTFMFTDRGIYRPGETVTFRGIDRDQLLGAFTTHSGWYSISVKGAWWNSKEIIEPIVGQLSDSGGFYGSFKIPDEIERGNYSIVYSRGENPNETAVLNFTIADLSLTLLFLRLPITAVTSFLQVSPLNISRAVRSAVLLMTLPGTRKQQVLKPQSRLPKATALIQEFILRDIIIQTIPESLG